MKDISFYIKTYGCQMNFHDSEFLEEGLIFKGFKKAASLIDADIIILNTCSVRDNADHKILSDIGRIADKNKKIILAGCYAQQKLRQNTNIKNININGNNIEDNVIKIAKNSENKELPVNYYVSPEDILSIPDILEKEFKSLLNIDTVNADNSNGGDDAENYYKRLEKSFNLRSENKRLLNSTQYLKITEGCNNFCSYCIVPYVRGAEKYIPLKMLLQTAEKYAEKNVKEIILLGQNVNSYKSPENSDYNFAYLLKKIIEIKNIKKIKFLTSHPKDMSDEVIELIGKENKISKSLHLPVQSGSDKILKLMNRGYDREDYLNLIKKLKSNCPDILLSTDIIVGFPGETDEDFEQTLSLVKETGFESIYGFQYSPRPFTAALNYKDDVPLEIKKERLNKLFNLQKNIFVSSLNKLIGNYYDVIIEKIAEDDDYNSEIINKGIFYKGITPNERTVYLKNFDMKKMSEFLLNSTFEKSESDLIKINIKITEVVSNKLYGEVI